MNEILKEIDEILALDECNSYKKTALMTIIHREQHKEWVRGVEDAEAIFLSK